jgi:hypothetical protein
VYFDPGPRTGHGFNGEVRIRFRKAVFAIALVAALALPAAAQAVTHDVAIGQTQSATVVPKGTLVTFTVDVKNLGTGEDDGVFLEIGSFADHGKGADTPYQSFATSQGSCSDQSGEAYGMTYHYLICELGPLAPGASARITAVAQVNQSASFSALLLPNAHEGGYIDENNSNNASGGRVTVSIPPAAVGSKKIKLTGLPAGCAAADFTLHVVAKAKKVKRMLASLFFWEGDEGVFWEKKANGKRLTLTIPVSRLSNEIGLTYKLKIKAKLRGTSRFLTKTVTFQPC